MRTAEGQGGKKKIATQLSKGLRERAASVLSPRRVPARLFITDADHPSLRRDGCTLLSLTVRK